MQRWKNACVLGADSKGEKIFLLDVCDDIVISFGVCLYIHLLFSKVFIILHF